MQIVENWSDIEGRVHQVRADSGVPGLVSASIDLERADDVEGFRNLLADSCGSVITILLPAEIASQRGLRTGTRLVARARRAGPERTFVHPDHLEVR